MAGGDGDEAEPGKACSLSGGGSPKAGKPGGSGSPAPGSSGKAPDGNPPPAGAGGPERRPDAPATPASAGKTTPPASGSGQPPEGPGQAAARGGTPPENKGRPVSPAAGPGDTTAPGSVRGGLSKAEPAAADSGKAPERGKFLGLPERLQRELQQGGTEKFPEEYRDMIEQYLKNLSDQAGSPSNE